jgi:ketosteroid isomerase-like protein
VSEENVALLRGIYAEWGKGNLVPGGEFYAPDAVFEPIAEGRETFDVAGFHGFMRGFLEQWDDFRAEPQDFLDLGDTVIVTEHQRATGRRSGIEIDMKAYVVWRFRDGLITGARWELDPEAARRAAEGTG